MLSLLSRRLIKQSTSFFKNLRTFLSDSYICQKTWEARKSAPIFSKTDYDDLYHQLDRSFQIGQRISVLDVDVFVNGIDSEIFKNELEDVLFKLRLNPESGLLRDRTMHAVILYYVKIGDTKELLNILSHRLTFGIFPNLYLSNMLMDSFLKQGDVLSATKIAVLNMLQEDFENPILRALSIYSCLKYLSSSEVWEPPKEPEVDEDEEEERIRVKCLRNPYFDDHFDLVDTNHLVGKTLVATASHSSGPLANSAKLIGLALFEKHSSAKEFLNQLAKSKETIHEEAIDRALEFTRTRPKLSADAKKPEDSEEVSAEKAELIAELEKAKKSLNIVSGQIEDVAAAEVTEAVKIHEGKDRDSIEQLYSDWVNEREGDIQYEIFESKKRKAIQEISKTKEQLSKEEQMIFFFDKEDEWDLKVQKKEEEIQAVEQQKRTKVKASEEEYVPPDVEKKRN